MPSYYPITAYEAQSGQMLRVQNRPGNVHDGKASLGFLRALFAQLAAAFGGTRLLEFRMDAAFFRRDVLALLEAAARRVRDQGPVPHVDGAARRSSEAHRHWTPVDATVSCFERAAVVRSPGSARCAW